MEPEDPLPDGLPTPSLRARLRERFGADVDPRIDLEGSRPATPARSAAALPSETLRRLEERETPAARYRMHGEIARGGMGAILEVYDEDLRRRLAMKVILDRRTGNASSAEGSVEPVALSRFLEEAQITGQLDHPGIVPVHELGLDEKGQVYFTMRLVQGRDLETIFDLAARAEEDWSLPRALAVLQKVCEAMAFAHEKGVVHRDLKPGNVMVGRFGEVYVMDWGLARVTQRADRHDLGVRTERKDAASSRNASAADDTEALHTMDGDVVGTPSYMAPEQARGQLAAIDERSDVYAVGAMLYRLLAGHAPYAARGERPDALQVLERVFEGPPEPIESAARNAPAELVAICAKAMAREPDARYASMQALAQDLRAFLEGRVVGAFETGALAEARKWVRRNRGLAAALAAAVLALVVGLSGSLVFAGRGRDSARVAEVRRVEAATSAELAEQRRQEAAASAASAQQQARIAQEVNAFLNDDLLASIAPEHDGKDVTVRAVLDQASQSLDEAGLGTDPEVEAALRMTIGTSYERLGEAETARRHLERALELRQTQGRHSEPVLQSMRAVAAVWHELGRYDEAIELFQAALALARDILGPEHRGTLATMNDLALVLSTTGRVDEALELQRATLAIEERVLGADEENTLTTRANVAMLDREQGRLEAAEQGLREVLERRRSLEGDHHPLTLLTMTNLSLVLADQGRLEEGEALARQVLDEYRRMFESDHPKVAVAVNNVGLFEFQRGHIEEAEALFAEALELRLKRSDPGSVEVLLTKHNLAASIRDPERLDEVLDLQEEVLAGYRRLLGPAHPSTLESMEALATTLRWAGLLDDAEALEREMAGRQGKAPGTGRSEVLKTE